MEVDDPLSAKFRTLVEGLMMTTTSEIVKIFSKFLTETRMEITRSWKEIDQLKQQLEDCELQKTEAILRAQMLAELKREDDEVEVSHWVSQPGGQNANTVAPQTEGSEERSGSSSLENRQASLENACAGGPEAGKSSSTGESSSERRKSHASKNNPRHSQDTHGTQTVVEPSNTSQMKGETLANGPSSSTGTLKSKEKKSVVTKRRLKKKHANDIRVARALRDRQQLSMQKRCLCCSFDECYLQSSPSRAHHQVPTVYVCRKCEKRFKTHILFKSHKCSMPQSCDRCGQVFATMQGLSAHSREGRPLFSCSQCDQMFATQCAWNLHKRIHDNGTKVQKDFKAKLQVRLERIPDSQLEAALRTKRFSLQDNPNSSKCTQNGTAAERFFDSSVEDGDVRKVYAVMSASSSEDTISYQSPLAHGSDQIKDEEKQYDESDHSGLSPKKRKMSDCTHDAYNGVFPVEKILKWRNNKGNSEVRVKWMPCTLCGAKFQNTWEPAESFPGFLDDMDEEP